MTRNLKKESEWRAKKYSRLVVDLDHEYADKLKDKLKKKNMTWTEFVKKEIENFMKNK